MATPKLSPKQFADLAPALSKQLTDALEKELADCAWQPDPTTDLWDLPTVDSKTVCKLSPVVQAATGHKLEAPWVRKGGYASVGEAVADVMARLQENCVAPAAGAAIAAE